MARIGAGNGWYIPPELESRITENELILGEIDAAKQWYDERRSNIYAVKLKAIRRANSLREQGDIDEGTYSRLRAEFTMKIEPFLIDIENTRNQKIEQALEKAGASSEAELWQRVETDYAKMKAYRPNRNGVAALDFSDDK